MWATIWSKNFPSKDTDKGPHMKFIPAVYRQAIAAKMGKSQESKVLQKIMGEVSFIKQDI